MFSFSSHYLINMSPPTCILTTSTIMLKKLQQVAIATALIPPYKMEISVPISL